MICDCMLDSSIYPIIVPTIVPLISQRRVLCDHSHFIRIGDWSIGTFLINTGVALATIAGIMQLTRMRM